MFNLPPDRVTRPPFDLISPFLALPDLRAFWPMGSADDALGVFDLSGQSRTLTLSATGAARGVYNNFVPYWDLDGSAGFLSRADESALSITGAMTAGLWFWADVSGGTERLLSKHGASGNFSYDVQKIAGDVIRWGISGDGTAQVAVDTAAIGTARWNFVAVRYNPSTEIAIFLNDAKTTNTTSIPASIFNSTSALNLGRWPGGATNFFNGRLGPGFICAFNCADDLIRSLFAQTRHFFDV